MTLFFISFLVVALVVAGMAVGVLAGRPPIKGSCGGMGALGIDTACEICGGDPRRCDEETREGEVGRENPGLYYPAHSDAANRPAGR
ncbi:MAG: (Na+)-NQR maturation NqrM [Halioglobus sp.]|nr:(Na+)-NQR maturation NqrM [Halioglobus sp.]